MNQSKEADRTWCLKIIQAQEERSSYETLSNDVDKKDRMNGSSHAYDKCLFVATGATSRKHAENAIKKLGKSNWKIDQEIKNFIP